MQKSILKKALKSPFVKRVSVLVGGTAIGQLIAILTLPVLTRLYDPDAFSVLAVYVSALSILTVISGMCFEYAIPLPKSDRIAAALFLLASTSVLVLTLLVSLVIILLPDIFNTLTKNKISHLLWFIPIGVFSVGIYNTLQYWSTRHKKFKLIAKTRVTQSLAGTCVKLGSGYFLNGLTAGLIFGQLIAQGSGVLRLSLSLLKNDWQTLKKIKFKYLKLALIRYDQFPKFTTLEVFANTAGIQIPVLLIAYYAAGPEAGYLMIAMQLLSAPMSMISGAISQVYLAEGADKFHKGSLQEFTKKTILNLVKISFVPLFILALLAPFLIPLLLGFEWSRTGALISWMTPWFFMQFITSPVSTVMYITKNQKLAFALQFVGLIIRVGAVFFAALFATSYIGEYYAVSGFIFYSIYLMVIFKVIRKIPNKD